MVRSYLLLSLFLLLGFSQLAAQNKLTDSNTPLNLLQPDYPIPYGLTQINDIEIDETAVQFKQSNPNR